MRRDELLEPAPICVRLKRAARMLGLSERATWELASTGRLPSVRLADRVRLFVVEDLREWARQRAAEARALPDRPPSSSAPGSDIREGIGGTGRDEEAR